MSVELVSRVLHHSHAQSHSKVILMAIAWHTEDQSKGCWPPREVLANYANVSVRTLSRSLIELQELGELEVVQNGAWMRGSVTMHNLYRIKMACPDECDGTLNHKFLGS